MHKDRNRYQYISLIHPYPASFTPYQVPTGRWTHVAVVHKGDSVNLFCDGEPFAASPLQLPPYVRRPRRPTFRTIVKRVESPHPYPHHMSEDYVVSIPGAAMIRVTFDPRTKYVHAHVVLGNRLYQTIRAYPLCCQSPSQKQDGARVRLSDHLP